MRVKTIPLTQAQIKARTKQTTKEEKAYIKQKKKDNYDFCSVCHKSPIMHGECGNTHCTYCGDLVPCNHTCDKIILRRK